MRSRHVVAASLGALTLGAVLVHARAAHRWDEDTERARARLVTSRTEVGPFGEPDLEGLPAPVQRYLRKVVPLGHPLIRHATFNMGKPPNDAWKPFTAVQDFVPAAPGFVWDARVRMFPGVDAWVRDSFVEGQGRMFAKAAALITVVDAHDTPELARGALLRYLAETPWFPTSMLPRQGVQWSPLDDRHARAAITVGATTVSYDFTFGDDDLLVSGEGLRDSAEMKGQFPWGGLYSDWIDVQGIKIPSRAEVYWRFPSGRFAYYRGVVAPVFD